MKEQNDSSSGGAVRSAVVTGVATVLAACIAIVPLARQSTQQKQTIDDLNNLNEKLTKQLNAGYTLNGSVKPKKNSVQVNDAFLISTGDALYPDDNGKFSLPGKSLKSYWIVVETQDGKASRLLLDPKLPETDTDELAITYSFSKE